MDARMNSHDVNQRGEVSAGLIDAYLTGLEKAKAAGIDLADAAAITTLRRDIHAHPELGFQEQRTAQRLLDGLAQDGFTGSYPTVQRFVKAWHEERRHGRGTVFIPQSAACTRKRLRSERLSVAT